MKGAQISSTSEQSALATEPDRRCAPRRRRWVFAAVAAVLAIAGVLAGVTRPFGHGGNAATGAGGNSSPTSTQPVIRQDLSEQTSIDATLGYAGSYSVLNEDQGTITWLPAAGQVIHEGQILYRVSDNPVVLLYGSTPVYRALSEGVSGPDVTQLNAALVALGYATSSEISPTSDYFGSETTLALESLQKALGLSQTGTLSLGEAVFLPSAARISTVSATLGAPAQPGQAVLAASSVTRQVVINLDAADQSEVSVGDKVTITLPDGRTAPGTVTSVGKVATSGSTPTVTVDVTPDDPAAVGSLDGAPVQVSITTASVTDALVVPVDALLARASGGYAVEVVAPDGVRHLVTVSLGLFDDAAGLVQVTGAGLSVGQLVVVPSL